MSSALDASFAVLSYLLYRESVLRWYRELSVARGWPWEDDVRLPAAWNGWECASRAMGGDRELQQVDEEKEREEELREEREVAEEYQVNVKEEREEEEEEGQDEEQDTERTEEADSDEDGEQGRPGVPWSQNARIVRVSAGKTRTKDKYRVVYSDAQRLELEKEFRYNNYITIKRKLELSRILGLTDRQVKIWFQNRRAKERKQKRRMEETAKRQMIDLQQGGGGGGPAASDIQLGGLNHAHLQGVHGLVPLHRQTPVSGCGGGGGGEARFPRYSLPAGHHQHHQQQHQQHQMVTKSEPRDGLQSQLGRPMSAPINHDGPPSFFQSQSLPAGDDQQELDNILDDIMNFESQRDGAQRQPNGGPRLTEPSTNNLVNERIAEIRRSLMQAESTIARPAFTSIYLRGSAHYDTRLSDSGYSAGCLAGSAGDTGPQFSGPGFSSVSHLPPIPPSSSAAPVPHLSTYLSPAGPQLPCSGPVAAHSAPYLPGSSGPYPTYLPPPGPAATPPGSHRPAGPPPPPSTDRLPSFERVLRELEWLDHCSS
ncbi:Homeobox protein CHOX-CAD [Amphibalanus amphitrite]|uniref:Homeobox protein CHOX-CAD n=1 Tax=Amphibalanus amphitrite TaxID=1232801 RepID=A0A6A4WCC2_AMPAM|nr:Homeobox protein CHOX-CAD [Amphibalanus amphitrite]